MAKKPVARAASDGEMKPYLGPEKYIQNVADCDYKTYIADGYKYLASNRPRTIPRPEIFAWEKIFKIDFNSRFRDGRKRWFDLQKNPNPSIEERLRNYFRR
jgi:hypothetical protein